MSCYFNHEVGVGQFYGNYGIGLDPFKSNFYVWYYFYIKRWKCHAKRIHQRYYGFYINDMFINIGFFLLLFIYITNVLVKNSSYKLSF